MPTPSCDQCHRKRLQCAGGKPTCNHCANTEQVCTYSTGKPVGKPKGHRKVKRNDSTELHPKSETARQMFRQQRSGTTSGSSPSFSDVNETGSPPWKEATQRTIDGSISSPSIAGSISAETTLSPFTVLNYSSPGMELERTQTAFMPDAMPHDPNMELINFTSAVTAMPMATSGNAVLSLPLSHFEWQPMLEHSSTTMPTQFGPPLLASFDPPFLMPPHGNPHHPSHQNGNAAFSNGGEKHVSSAYEVLQGQVSSVSGDVFCHDLPKIITLLFRSHFNGRTSFDTALNLVHGCIEEAWNFFHCTRCSVPHERHSMIVIMVLQQSTIACQTLLQLAINEVDEQSQSRPLRQDSSRGKEHTNNRNFTNGTHTLQASVRVSVAEAEVATLRQLTEDFKASVIHGDCNAGGHSSLWPILEAIDESLALLQQRAPSLRF